MYHLSYSQISLFKECAKLWQASYRQGKKQVPNSDLVFGSAIHKALEYRVAKQAPDILAFWDHIWLKEFSLQPNVAWHVSPEELHDLGRRIFSAKQVLALVDSVEPMMINNRPVIERKIEWRIPGVPPIVGYIDCIANDGVPIDFKTTSTMWSIGHARQETQPLFYMAALDSLGEHDHQYRFRHFVITKGAFPTAQVLETERTAEQVEEIKAIIAQVWEQISTANFQPNAGSWLCSTACQVLDECLPGQERWYGHAIT